MSKKLPLQNTVIVWPVAGSRHSLWRLEHVFPSHRRVTQKCTRQNVRPPKAQKRGTIGLNSKFLQNKVYETNTGSFQYFSGFLNKLSWVSEQIVRYTLHNDIHIFNIHKCWNFYCPVYFCPGFTCSISLYQSQLYRFRVWKWSILLIFCIKFHRKWKTML